MGLIHKKLKNRAKSYSSINNESVKLCLLLKNDYCLVISHFKNSTADLDAAFF